MEIKKITRLSMFLCLSVVLNIIESFIPLFDGSIPGIKLGLANVIVLIVLYLYSFKDAMYISILRVLLVGILRTGIFSVSFFFSFGGAVLSVLIMWLVKKTRLSIIGVSIIGAISHSIGQILIAIILIKNFYIVYYIPWLLLFSVPTGILTGIISKYSLNYLENRLQ
ncbi:MAG: Gx transporter family protein [Firmicutes bacterium]|nr:Gx transporter family protein [Bacillota bacterium]